LLSNLVFKLDRQENMASNETAPAGIIGGTGDEPTAEARKIALPKIDYLTGWRVWAVGIAIVLSMFLVCPSQKP
jgi:hypothetical protein